MTKDETVTMDRGGSRLHVKVPIEGIVELP